MSVAKDSNTKYDQIFTLLTEKSFGQAVYGDQHYKTKLREALPLITAALQIRQPDDLKADIALDIGSKLLNENIVKLKKHNERRLCFEAALVMLLYIEKCKSQELFQSFEHMLVRYPEFERDPTLDAAEKQKLLDFRNIMTIALKIIPGASHKNHLLDLVTRLSEGRSVKYCTGSGESIPTSRRVLIYRREGAIIPTPKKPKGSRQLLATQDGNNEEEEESSNEGSHEESNLLSAAMPTMMAVLAHQVPLNGVVSSCVSSGVGEATGLTTAKAMKKRVNHNDTDFAARAGKKGRHHTPSTTSNSINNSINNNSINGSSGIGNASVRMKHLSTDTLSGDPPTAGINPLRLLEGLPSMASCTTALSGIGGVAVGATRANTFELLSASCLGGSDISYGGSLSFLSSGDGGYSETIPSSSSSSSTSSSSYLRTIANIVGSSVPDAVSSNNSNNNSSSSSSYSGGVGVHSFLGSLSMNFNAACDARDTSDSLLLPPNPSQFFYDRQRSQDGSYVADTDFWKAGSLVASGSPLAPVIGNSNNTTTGLGSLLTHPTSIINGVGIDDSGGVSDGIGVSVGGMAAVSFPGIVDSYTPPTDIILDNNNNNNIGNSCSNISSDSFDHSSSSSSSISMGGDNAATIEPADREINNDAAKSLVLLRSASA